MKRILCLVLTFALALCLAAPSAMAAAPISVKVNGSSVEFADAKPVNKEGRVLAPLRPVFEKLGCQVEWNQASKTASITHKGNTLKVKIGSSELYLNNKKLNNKLDVRAQLIDSRTYIPLRIPAEALGFNVEWENASKTVKVRGTGIAPSESFTQSEAIFRMIGNTKSKAGAYFKGELNNIATLKQSLNEMDTATKKADFIYSAGFLVIDATNVTTSIKGALDEGGATAYDAITDAQETILGYAESTENMSVSQWFVASARASYSNYLKLSENLLELHMKRIDKGYLSYSENLSYCVTFYLMELEKKTVSTAVSLLIDDAADGICSGVALTAKKFTFHLMPGNLGDNIEMMLDLGGNTMKSYYTAVNNYRNKISDLLY